MIAATEVRATQATERRRVWRCTRCGYVWAPGEHRLTDGVTVYRPAPAPRYAAVVARYHLCADCQRAGHWLAHDAAAREGRP